MKSSSLTFRANAEHALLDTQLQRALDKAGSGFIERRRAAMDALPVFEQLRHTAREVKEHTLSLLDEYLLQFERQVISNGGQVHWASTPKQATDIIVGLCHEANARKVTKGKTMVGEEVGLNEALQAAGISPVETDLGEYIIQLADEPPSHIIAPAIHKTREQITALFRQHHARYGLSQPLETVPAIVNEARQVLREEFIQAEVGITGANLLIAETGSTVLVTNEGNGDLTASLPRVHIVIASIEKIVPTLEDATVILRLLARSATGQEITSYTSFFTGPKRQTDLDGPDQFHVVLVDNGRTNMLGNEFHPMLRCIHCGACLNHCPVYSAIGGHAYGWVYPGPMGSVLTPLMIGLKQAPDLPQASSLCGRCAEVCPMSIPLPELLRQHRFQLADNGAVKLKPRLALAAWGFLATRPRLYHWVMNMMTRVLHWASRGRGRLQKVPFAGGWTQSRDLPAPQGDSFIRAWQQQAKRKANND